MIARRRNNRHRRTPIPRLAEHIARFTGDQSRVSREAFTRKHNLAAIRAAFADKVYAASEPIRKETTKCRI